MTPKQFEAEYPVMAKFLQDFYAARHEFICPKEHKHRLPYFLHCGRDYCKHTPLKFCQQ